MWIEATSHPQWSSISCAAGVLEMFHKASILRMSLSASIGLLRRADGYRLVLNRDLEAAADAILPMLDW
jgi:hypothetical protein